ncbi:hypothetical protein [Lentilactobacillus kisonensis]|uniref:Uncharacterized protein n=2 Tax=Lentilactobacillus kisonensis TaxID=481722 RepID=H1LDL9_9LACO|nr:hypothetical protein [Lentilactobacillus kisonensis]EHO53129.1 hypothetical protein HMPREF9104_00694 [Lentilactobacillus kisonensis F0435]KRL21003.1 hypothetical protein FC98_GL000944 [Lentilactobacillus kisonensis DSM 19906 = JCM 15041]
MTNTTNWQVALKSQIDFRNFIEDYFQGHDELTGRYSNTAYYEYYTVRLGSSDNLQITMQTGVTAPANFGLNQVPYKDVETISIEQFRQLILNKKFAEKGVSLADAFKAVAGVPGA